MPSPKPRSALSLPLLSLLLSAYTAFSTAAVPAAASKMLTSINSSSHSHGTAVPPGTGSEASVCTDTDVPLGTGAAQSWGTGIAHPWGPGTAHSWGLGPAHSWSTGTAPSLATTGLPLSTGKAPHNSTRMPPSLGTGTAPPLGYGTAPSLGTGTAPYVGTGTAVPWGTGTAVSGYLYGTNSGFMPMPSGSGIPPQYPSGPHFHYKPSIYSKATPSVTCQPPCNIVLPPYTLPTPTTLSYAPLTTTLTETYTSHTTITTTVQSTVLDFPPITTSIIPVFNLNIMEAGASTYSITPSIFPVFTGMMAPPPGDSAGTSRPFTVTSYPAATGPWPTISGQPTHVSFSNGIPPPGVCTSNCGSGGGSGGLGSRCTEFCNRCGVSGCEGGGSGSGEGAGGKGHNAPSSDASASPNTDQGANDLSGSRLSGDQSTVDTQCEDLERAIESLKTELQEKETEFRGMQCGTS